MRRGRVILQAWEQRFLDERDATLTTTRCANCDWIFEGELGKSRDAFLEHRQQAHPEINPATKHKRIRPNGISLNGNLHDNIGNARAQGAAGWASE